MNLSIVLAGHSHVHAMGVSGIAASPGTRLVPVTSERATIVGVAGTRDDQYWAAFVEASRTHIPAVIWDGNQHYGYFMFAPRPPFDFVLSSAPGLAIDRSIAIVPEAMVREFLAPSLVALRDLLVRLKATSPHRAIVIGTPPPKGDLNRLCANFASEPHFSAWAQKHGLTIEPASLSTVPMFVKLWRLLQGMLAEIAADHGALFVPVPRRLQQGDGLLRDDQWSTDATHASNVYGKAMLEEVIDAAGRTIDRSAAE